MKLLIHSQTSTVAPLKFGNGKVISSHTSLDMWLLIHVLLKVQSKQRKRSLYEFDMHGATYIDMKRYACLANHFYRTVKVTMFFSGIPIDF